MEVDWHSKWMLIPYGQGHSFLQGELMILPTGSVIQVTALLLDDTVARQGPVPPEIADLLIEF